MFQVRYWCDCESFLVLWCVASKSLVCFGCFYCVFNVFLICFSCIATASVFLGNFLSVSDASGTYLMFLWVLVRFYCSVSKVFLLFMMRF